MNIQFVIWSCWREYRTAFKKILYSHTSIPRMFISVFTMYFITEYENVWLSFYLRRFPLNWGARIYMTLGWSIEWIDRSRPGCHLISLRSFCFETFPLFRCLEFNTLINRSIPWVPPLLISLHVQSFASRHNRPSLNSMDKIMASVNPGPLSPSECSENHIDNQFLSSS